MCSVGIEESHVQWLCSCGASAQLSARPFPGATVTMAAAPAGSAEDIAKNAWVALRNATATELPRHWGDWVQIPDLARFIAADEQELTAIIRDHTEFFRLYRGGQPPWYVAVATPRRRGTSGPQSSGGAREEMK